MSKPSTAATLLAATAAATIFMSSPALASTSIGSSTTTPLKTSTSGDITVTSGGTVAVASGNAVTVDSNNTVSNAGAIKSGSSNGDSGIVVNAGTTTTIANTGSISVTELFTPTTDGQSTTGPIASASDRYGLHVLAGAAVTGNINDSGTITVDGLNSAGIAIDATLNGTLNYSGTTTVIGDNSVGLRTAAVNGSVFVTSGTITAAGPGATAMAINGDVTGSVTIEGTVQQAQSYVDSDGTTLALTESALSKGAPAVVIAGNVAGGVSVAAPPTDATSSDTNGNGVADNAEGTGSIIGYGNGPALLIGSANPITIGALTGNAGGYSLVIDGSVSSNAVSGQLSASGVVIGGQGGTVSLPGGIAVDGSVTATAVVGTANAILINPGATATTLYNSGTIRANISSSGSSSAYAVHDLSGTLTSIDNTGNIIASGTGGNQLQAINLAANTSGVTITQDINSTNAATRTTAESGGNTDNTAYESITGDIVTGSGNDTFNVNDGTVTGNTNFGGGNDTLNLSGRGIYNGVVTFGAGTPTVTMAGTSSLTGGIDFDGMAGSLTIGDSAVFSGSIANGQAASVTVNGGTFGANAATTSQVGTLTVNSGGEFGAYINGKTGTSSLVVANSATLASGSKVYVTLSSLSGVEGAYTILTANTLSSQATFDSSTTNLPYVFTGSVSAGVNDLTLTIRRKTEAELAQTIDRAAAQASDAIITAAITDAKMSTNILEIRDAATLQTQFNQLLPDHAGGVFDMVTRGSRMVAQHVMDGDSLFSISDVGGWLEPVYWGAKKDQTDTASYSGSGWGISTGLEKATGIGRIGLSYAFLHSTVDDNGGTGRVKVTQHEFGAFWRTQKGPFYAFARGSAALLSISSARTYTGDNAGTSFSYANTGSWKGLLVSATGGASYDLAVSRALTMRPKVSIEYYRLHENGYAESGGGTAMDLTVLGRNSNSLSANTSLTASYSFGTRGPDNRPLTFELEGGRRSLLSGTLGTTQASFDNGAIFSITADKPQSSWFGEARLLAGGLDFTWKLAARAERTNDGQMDYSGRASLSIAL